MCQIDDIRLDPDNLLTECQRNEFKTVIVKFKDSFSSKLGRYNGALGNLDAKLIIPNTIEPPSFPCRRFSQPEALNKKQQEVMDKMEADGILVRPEDVGIMPTHVHPSFMVPKMEDGKFTGEYRLVTGLASLSPFLKPSRVPLPTIEEAFRKLSSWKYLVIADLKSWHWQIPISKDSMRFFGTTTPYGGLRLYAVQPMGYLNANENADLVIQNVLFPAIREGKCVRIADNLFTGGQTPEEAAKHFHLMLQLCANSGLTFKASKTIICPKQITILGKIWEQGSIRPSSHLVSTLTKADYPVTVKQMRSFTGSVKQMKDNLPNYHILLHPLEKACAGKKSADRIIWNDELRNSFNKVKKAASDPETLTLPQPGEKLFIFPDWSDMHQAGGAPLFVKRSGKLLKVRNFGQRLNTVKRWAPCEGESWIARIGVEAHAPWIWEALPSRTEINCDNMPSVLAAKRLQRGEFSKSVRVTYFLSTLAAYPVDIVYRKGAGHPGDYDSRHAISCGSERCQICQFAFELAGPTALEQVFASNDGNLINSITAEDIIEGKYSLPFTQSSGWKTIQNEHPTTRKLRMHMEGGTIPQRRTKNQTELKRLYDLFTKSRISVSKDNILVHQDNDSFGNISETILVPSQIMKGLVFALHNKLHCPSKLEMNKIIKRYWFSLGLPSIIEDVWSNCPRCQAAKSVPKEIFEQSTLKTDKFASNWSADVIRGDRQFIFCAREKLSSYTVAVIVLSEEQDELRNAIIQSTAELVPQHGLTMQVDNCPAFQALNNDVLLAQHGIKLDLGREKNKNSNPIAEKCIQEYREEKKKLKPNGGPVSSAELSLIIASLNRRIRNRNLSAKEILTRRDQFSNESLNIDDQSLSEEQFKIREANHPTSAKSKAKTSKPARAAEVWPGALVYLKKDLNKLRIRETYLVVKIDKSDGSYCYIKKFENQCRNKDYRVKRSEIELIPNQSTPELISSPEDSDSHISKSGLPVNVKTPIKDRISIRPGLRQKKRPDYKLMNEGMTISRLKRVDGKRTKSYKYGWDTPDQDSSSEEIVSDTQLSPIYGDFGSDQESTQWDYSYIYHNSTLSNEYVETLPYDEEVFEEQEGLNTAQDLHPENENFEEFHGPEISTTVPRRSSRIRKPPSYRGIDDYVTFYDQNKKKSQTDARFLSEESDLDSVNEGETATVVMGSHRKSRSEPSSPSAVVQLDEVVNLNRVILPHRPLVMETVRTDGCQWLERPLNDWYHRKETRGEEEEGD